MKCKLFVKIIAVAVSCLILFCMISFAVFPKESFSENENRSLASFPKYSFETLKDGRFIADIERYLTDHFPFRDAFMCMKSVTELKLGKKIINDVIIADDGYFMDVYGELKTKDKIIKAFSALEQGVKKADISFMLVPTAPAIYPEKLPAHVTVHDQMRDIRDIYQALSGRTIDVSSSLLQHKNDHQLFYRLDHHWTTYGAYYAYEAYCRQLNLTPVSMSDFTIEKVTDDFRGTTYSKVNDYTVQGDDIYLFKQNGLHVTVDYTDTMETADSMYALSYLEKKDKYSLFLDNIHASLEVTNHDLDSEKELVIIKDSYANCMVPFLINHYKKIYVIDPRHYQETISDFINSTAADEVLVLYNMGTIGTDTGIGSIY